ncbi:hypothetical protein ISCGN_007981 [Ixodes scapularis]
MESVSPTSEDFNKPDVTSGSSKFSGSIFTRTQGSDGTHSVETRAEPTSHSNHQTTKKVDFSRTLSVPRIGTSPAKRLNRAVPNTAHAPSPVIVRQNVSSTEGLNGEEVEENTRWS